MHTGMSINVDIIIEVDLQMKKGNGAENNTTTECAILIICTRKFKYKITYLLISYSSCQLCFESYVSATLLNYKIICVEMAVHSIILTILLLSANQSASSTSIINAITG